MTVKPFRWEHLKKLSKAQLALESWYRQIAAAAGLSRQTLVDISEWLTHYLEIPWSVEPLGYSGMAFGTYMQETASGSVLAQLSVLPLDRKFVAAVDRDIVEIALARLLGGSPSRAHPLGGRAWTDIEGGLIEYLFVKVLSELKALGGAGELIIRLDRVTAAGEDLQRLYQENEPVIVSRFRVEAASHRGTVAIALPHPVLEPLTQLIPSDRGLHDPGLENRLQELGHVPTSLWAEVGETSIGLKELGSLHPGDVLLLDRATVHIKDGLPSGHVGLRVGQGIHGRINAELLPSAGGVRARITAKELT